MKILVVDDDGQFLEATSVALRTEWDDCSVLLAMDVESGVIAVEDQEPDIVLLDVTFRDGKTGFDVLREIRRVSDVPVIMLTGRGAEMDQVRGLEGGADDYVVKPFGYPSLFARIRSVLRRRQMVVPKRALADFESGDLLVNSETHVVSKAGEPLKLTPTEYKLLYLLVSNEGRIMPHQALLERVWGGERDATPDHLKVFISRLRSKIGRGPGGHQYIETERGTGYRFVRPRPSASG